MDECKPILYDLNPSELQELLAGWNEPLYRSHQIWQGIYQNLWQTPQEFSTLPASLKEKLSAYFCLEPLTQVESLKSRDKKTTKLLFNLQDGRTIETVLMRYNERRTACISTQAGCAMGCSFCATGQMGFHRHLSSGEIVAQVLYLSRLLFQEQDRLTNIVIMGMGEPFHNYNATIAAIGRLNDSKGFNFGERRFTISTSGLIPGIQRFTAEKRQINLAVSLHAANDDLRNSLMPINRKYPLGPLMDACKEYVEKTGRRITFEWALIHGVNDNLNDAQELIRLIRGLLCHVNIIPLNPTVNYKGKATTPERAQAFQKLLEYAGIPCTIRIRRGIDIQAGCGQLASLSNKQSLKQ